MVYLRLGTNKTPYEWWEGKKSTAKYFHVFGSKCFILRDRENLCKFDRKSDEGIFLGYSSSSRAYQVYNKKTETVMETINVVVDDSPNAPCEWEVQIVEDGKEVAAKKTSEDLGKHSDTVGTEEPSTPKPKMITTEPASRLRLNHPEENILGDLNKGKRLRSRVINQVSYTCYLSKLEPKNMKEAPMIKAG